VGERLTSEIASGAAAFGITLPDGALDLYNRYYELLTEKNAVMNLTAISGEAETARLHILDSLAVIAALNDNATNTAQEASLLRNNSKSAAPATSPLRGNKLSGKQMIDIGSGAGAPGLIIAIAQPELRVTLLESREKRAEFLSDTISALGLTNVIVAAARAEEYIKERRAELDLVTARGVARLNVLCELCLPFLRIGGLLAAHKAADTDGETEEAAIAARAVGGELQNDWEYTLPGGAEPRRIVVFSKTGETDRRYPRRWAAIQRAPLGAVGE
jgi:16S rRNA (guanine527-N7)-methyltransferase